MARLRDAHPGMRRAGAGDRRRRRRQPGDPRGASPTKRPRDGFRLVAPPPRLCADNAVMIAWAGAERLALGLTDRLDAPARPRWPLDETAPRRCCGARCARERKA